MKIYVKLHNLNFLKQIKKSIKYIQYFKIKLLKKLYIMVMKITIMASYTFLIIENIKIKYSTKYVLLLFWGKRGTNI